MKKDDAYDSDSCGEDYAGQPPDDDQSFIVPRRGLEPDTGPDDDPMTVQRRGSPSDTDSFVSEEDMDEYPDEYSDDGDELDTFILPYPTGSKLGKKKRKKKHKKKSKKKSGASSKGVDILKLAASMEGDDEDVQLTDDEQKPPAKGRLRQPGLCQMEENLHTIAKTLKTSPAEITEKITHLQKEVKELQSENESLKSKMAQDSLGNVMDQVVEVKGVKVLASAVDGVDMNGLRDLGDQLKEKLGEGVVVLASAKDGKVSLLAMATQGAMDKGAHAGNLIKAAAAIVGGGGGGRPNMAQAGGKNPDKIPEAIAKVAELVEGQLK